MSAKWIRVTRQFKCPVCNHPDWCTIGERWICCMRVQSVHPAKNGGWFHPIGENFKAPIPVLRESEPRINATEIMREYKADTSQSDVEALARRLGVTYDALSALGTGWSQQHQAWAFPMLDEYGNVIGIRLRNDSGKKWAVTGSRAGLFFVPGKLTGEAFVLEGPTDTAAALTIGIQAVGRPSCQGQEEMIAARLRNASRVIIIADNDEPGIKGAERLQEKIKVPSVIWCTPTKDLREFVRNGGTMDLVRTMIKPLRWTIPQENPQTSSRWNNSQR